VAKKNFNIPLPNPEVAERFDRFTRPKGHKKGYAVVGALELFMILPADIRELLMEGRIDEAKAWIENLRKDAASLAVLRSAGFPKPHAARKRRDAGKCG
jgi:hypothetical protein